MKNLINQKIEDALNSAQAIGRAEPSHFLFTKIEAKLDKEKAGPWNRFWTYLTNPAIAFAGLCILLLINALIIFGVNSRQSPQIVELATVDEYNLVSSTYELDNLNP